MFEFIYRIMVSPLGLPLDWFSSYMILFAIGVVAYKPAYELVGKMYAYDLIDGSVEGSFFHWFFRGIIFIGIWAVVYGSIWVYKWINEYMLAAQQIAITCVIAIVLSFVIVSIYRFIRKKISGAVPCER